MWSHERVKDFRYCLLRQFQVICLPILYNIWLLFTASNDKREIAFVSDSSTEFTESQSKRSTRWARTTVPILLLFPSFFSYYLNGHLAGQPPQHPCA